MKEMSIVEKLNMQFYRCHKLFKRNFFEQHMEHIKAVPFRGQGKILKLLLTRGEMSQKDIVIEMDIRPSTVWELVSKLEKSGYVEKIPNPEDKRGSFVRLTESGKREAISAKWDLNNMQNELYSVLSEEEQFKLSELLGKLIVSLEKTEAKQDDIRGKADERVDKEERKEERKEDKSEEEVKIEAEEVKAKRVGRGKNFCDELKDDIVESKKFFKELFQDLGLTKKEKSAEETPPEEVEVESADIPNDDSINNN